MNKGPIDLDKPMSEVMEAASDRARLAFAEVVNQTGGRIGEMIIIMAMMLTNIRLQSEDAADAIISLEEKLSGAINKDAFRLSSVDMIMKAAERGGKN